MEKFNLNKNLSTEKKLPSNIEAEQSLIGSILVNNDIIDEISNITESKEFFDPVHKRIEQLNSKGMIANPITLKNFFESQKNLDEVGGVEYLIKLTRFSSSVKQAIDYAKIIHETFVKRQLILISDEISSSSIDENIEKNSDSIIEDAEKSLFIWLISFSLKE